MKFDLQKADFWKRASALLFDIVMLLTLTVGIAVGMSALLKYDYYNGVVEGLEQEYSEKYNIDLDISDEDFNKLTPEQQQVYRDANDAFSKDERVIIGYNILLKLILAIITCSVLLAFVVLELVVPIFLKHGRTLGKKIFGLAVMRTHGVKMSGTAHFARSIVGKCAIETLVPIYLIFMILYGGLGIVGVVVLFLLLGLNLFAFCYTKRTRSTIHDLISDTVVVDMASQMIFNTDEELMEYKTKIHAEEVAKKGYF